MGWYESTKYPGVMLGDEAFDIAYEFLTELRKAYESEFERPPTLAEITNLLETTLHVNGREVIAGLEDLEVTAVAVKTAKKRRTQSYAEGDVFAVPLGEGRFAFGRILMIDKAFGCLVEIFRRTGRRPTLTPARAEDRLFQPALVLPEAFGSCRWTIIGRDESYRQSSELAKLEYVAGSPSLGYSVVTVRNQIVRPATEADLKSIPWNVIYQPKQLEDKIRKELETEGAT